MLKVKGENDRFTGARPTISLCLIVRDEAENLARCLASVQGVVDEMIVVDTGSRDETPQIARRFGAKVVDFPWTGDFSAARNVSLEQATGDWILYLDADEELMEEDRALLPSVVAQTDAEAILVQVINFVGDRVGEREITALAPRLFRRRPEYRFTGRVHEQIMKAIQQQGGKVVSSPLRINHYGYLNRLVQKKAKAERNLELLRQQVAEDPHNSFVRFNLGAEYVRLGNLDQALVEYQLAFKYLPHLAVEYAPFLVRNIVNLLLVQRRSKEALNILQEAKAAYPGYTDLIYLEGQAYLALYCHTEAVQAFQRCLAMGENSRYTSQRGVGSYLAWMGLGAAYEGLGELGKAVQAYRSALRANEQYLPALQKLGELILPREEREEAVAYLKGLVDWQGKPEAALVLAGLFADQGYAEEAQELLHSARFDSADGRAALARARILTVLHRYQEALADLMAIPETSEVYALGLCEVAFLQALLGCGEAAESALRRAEELGVQAGFLEGYRRVAAALAGTSPGETALKEVLQARQTILDLLERLLALQEFEAFERALLALHSLNLPPEEEAVELGKLYYRRGFLELAAAELLRAAQAGKEDAEIFAILGEVALKKEMLEEAEAFYRRAVELEPRRLAFYTALAGALAAQNRYADAAEALRGALRYYPDSDLLRETMRLTDAMARERKETGGAGASGS